MWSVAYVKIYALFGGTKLTQNLQAGTKFNFEDWDLGHPGYPGHPDHSDHYGHLDHTGHPGQWSPWLLCSSQPIMSTGPKVSPFLDFSFLF